MRGCGPYSWGMPRQRHHRHRLARPLVAGALTLGLALTGTAAWALDRYVVDHVEISDVSTYEAAHATANPAATTAPADDAGDGGSVTTATTYESADAGIEISTVTTGSGEQTVTYYVADVVLSDATVLRSAFAQDAFGQNITATTSEIAADNGAVLAVNGDYYGFRETGIVIRNGVVYRDAGARDGLAFYRDGHVGVYDETATDAQALVDAGVWNTLSFGPALVEDGAVVDGVEDVEVDTNVGNHSIQGDQPRTAIGVVGDNHLVIVVVDGRSPGYSAGVTLPELAGIMQGLGATTAYNLDGGGSSTLVFDGELVNDPLGRGQERGTSDILYVAG